jgi:hypothetical protein
MGFSLTFPSWAISICISTQCPTSKTKTTKKFINNKEGIHKP